MQHPVPFPFAIALCLAALAGFVDAIAFSHLGFFAAAMSGDATLLGVGLGSSNAGQARMAGALILSFVSGVLLSGVVTRAFPWRGRAAAMTMMTALLSGAAIAARALPDPFAMLLLAGAMGAGSCVFGGEGEMPVGIPYLTGALVRFGRHLAGALLGERHQGEWLSAALPWCAFLLGAVAGARSYTGLALDALWIATLAGGVLALVLLRGTPSGGAKPVPAHPAPDR